MKEIFLRENIESILDHLDEGIHIIDSNGISVYYNRKAELLDGVDRDKVVGKHLLEVYPSLTRETSTLLTSVRTGKRIEKKQQVFLNYMGKKITTENSTFPIVNGDKIIGAMEISKDITDVRQMSEQIVELTEKLYQGKKTNKESSNYAKYNVADIVGNSPKINEIKSMIFKAASTDVSVLVYGDTGTGKELVVHSIHNAGARRNRPFIVQNCAAIPQTLLEGILFGTVKGSFTGAENRAGLFELADGGTLFLDEINSMPLELQSKLLRVLQDKSIRRVGSTKTIDVDVRIMTAMNVSPEEAIEKSMLRRDLYYRLNILSFELPKLKDRRQDIPLLIEHFIEKFNLRFDKNVVGVSPEANRILMRYNWDGNIRELENLLEGIVSISDNGIIEASDLPIKLQNYSETFSDSGLLKEVLEKTEHDEIKNAMMIENGNVTRAAKRLGIPRQTLQYRLTKLNNLKK